MTKLERVARALCAAKGANPDQWEFVEAQARAAIEAVEMHDRLLAEEAAPRVTAPDRYRPPADDDEPIF